MLVREWRGLPHSSRTGSSVLRPPLPVPSLSRPVARAGGGGGGERVAGLRQRGGTKRAGLKHRGTEGRAAIFNRVLLLKSDSKKLVTGTHSLGAAESG